MLPETNAVGPRKSITEQLLKTRVRADDIEAVIFRLGTPRLTLGSSGKELTIIKVMHIGIIVDQLRPNSLPHVHSLAPVRQNTVLQAISRHEMLGRPCNGTADISIQCTRHKNGASLMVLGSSLEHSIERWTFSETEAYG